MTRARDIANFGDGIATADIDDGAVTAAKINSAVGLGITEADIFRLTADHTGNGDITANLDRPDDPSAGLIGTGMTESSGVFSFPETGIYLVRFVGRVVMVASDVTAQIRILVTVDNSTFDEVALPTAGNGSSSEVLGTAMGEALVDVTDLTNVKVKFETQNFSTGTKLSGSTSRNRTFATFIRLGDT